MARYSLRLRAVNWMLTSYDPYVTYEMIRKHSVDEAKTCSMLNEDITKCRIRSPFSSPNSASALALTHWCYLLCYFVFFVVRWYI